MVELRLPLNSKNYGEAMERFTNAILKSISDENWYAALFMSLTLPDICSRLQADNDKTNGKKYAAWFNRYVGEKYSYVHPSTKLRKVFMDGDACWALRCAMLHQGEADLTGQRVKSVLSSFHFTTTTGHCNRVDDVLQLDVAHFCRDICDSVDSWFSEFKKTDGADAKIESLLIIYLGESTLKGGMVTFSS
ncbi:hypothetical protein [Pseudomonas fluorescens]|nr:hypothetical protein [Pseudomonas fluorescens]MCI4607270.1 hypothetical protein [Pseudomonas fluorescens]TWR44737.1 hypothetical protein FIP59_24055 [Pseudomonas fluorescens]UKJ66727.1 hypothetical protein H1Q68_17460 [Pseudomonas fluorescens]